MLELFLTVVILESIVQQTILFASQKNVTFVFCIEELQAFIGVNIAMGMLRLPQIRDYWATNNILATPWFPSIMSRDRFLSILRFLHLADSTKQKKQGEQGYDPLFKVRPLIDHLSAVFQQYYQPLRQLSIDEMMVGTRCRIAFLQFMPKKPTRFGIKIWVNSEAKTGYVLKFEIYTGAHEGTREKGLSYRVVMELMEPFQGKGHCLFIDNFYTGPKLLLDLLERGTYSAGTVRPNRKGFPPDLKPSGSAVPGNMRFGTASEGRLTAVWWFDRRDVLALSTMHNTSATVVLKRPKGSREKQPIPCPTIISEYNAYMGGVDLMDQHLSYYSMSTRRTLKWWKKVFWRLVDICIINAWILFRQNNPNSAIKSQRSFRLKLAEELVQPLLNLKANPSCPPTLRVDLESQQLLRSD